MASMPTHAIIRKSACATACRASAQSCKRAQVRVDPCSLCAGQREIEVGSFVPPKLLPQLADTAEVLAYAKTLTGLFATVLVPNLQGAERALEGNADLMLLPLSASRAHSLANLRKTPDEGVAELARIRAAARRERQEDPDRRRRRYRLRLHPAGEVRASEVLRLMQALLDAGATVSAWPTRSATPIPGPSVGCSSRP